MNVIKYSRIKGIENDLNEALEEDKQKLLHLRQKNPHS